MSASGMLVNPKFRLPHPKSPSRVWIAIAPLSQKDQVAIAWVARSQRWSSVFDTPSFPVRKG